MRGSLARRLFRTILAIGLINVTITLVATEFIYEDIEETNLDFELAQEREFFENQIEAPRAQAWRTALLNAFFVPAGDTTTELPGIFRGRRIPFAAEVDLGAKTYLISIERTQEPSGVLYLAQDITVMEDREDTLQEVGIVAFAVCMLLLSYLLARMGTRRTVGPLQNLARQIAALEPGTAIARIQTDYADRELVEIARTLNELLAALDAYVRREKALVSLASHELRTPVAVIAGALDVLEQRESLSQADRRTVARIRSAVDEMQADVDALLKLARKAGDRDQVAVVDLADCVRAVVAEVENGAPSRKARIAVQSGAASPRVEADPALVHMLLRNLIENAVRHTRDAIRIDIGPHQLHIADEGGGLPPDVQARLGQRATSGTSVPEDGLGLFIVGLICERLNWQLQVERSSVRGTVLALSFEPAAHSRKRDARSAI